MAIATATALALAGTGLAVGSAALDRKSANKANDIAARNRADSQRFIEESVAKARGDIFKLYPDAQESRQKGLQAGLDLYEQSVPAQMQSFTGGNVAAQNMLLQGLPQMNAAIMGQPVNTSGLQSYQGQGLQGLTMPQAPQFSPITEGGQ